MRVGVGYCENTDTEKAGMIAAKEAIRSAGRTDPCSLAILFSTSSHDPKYLRAVIASVLGDTVPIVGGGAIGAISNKYYGYSGDQVVVAGLWLDGIGCNIHSEGGLVGREAKVGKYLGERMSKRDVEKKTPSILFYDAIDRSHGDVRMNLATPLLEGLEKGLGYLPDTLVGAGLQSDFDCSPYPQWTGRETHDQKAVMLTFSEELQIDSVIMHGCKPSGGYYTVTKAEKQTILEVDGQPALPYIASKLHPALPVESFPFFMIFGINRNPGGDFDPDNYTNRLCLAIDKKRKGIVMFESDMVEGTRFQIMYRSVDLDYMAPRINGLFDKAKSDGRKPVFAFYIDCAGRAAGQYGGADEEDAIAVQKAVDNRVPLMGICSGVEIAPVQGKPRTLDWTGVFCLFSVKE